MIVDLYPEQDDKVPAGRYFDQAVLVRQREYLARRAAVLAMNDELASLGMVIDQETGKVSFAR